MVFLILVSFLFFNQWFSLGKKKSAKDHKTFHFLYIKYAPQGPETAL